MPKDRRNRAWSMRLIALAFSSGWARYPITVAIIAIVLGIRAYVMPGLKPRALVSALLPRHHPCRLVRRLRAGRAGHHPGCPLAGVPLAAAALLSPYPARRGRQRHDGVRGHRVRDQLSQRGALAGRASRQGRGRSDAARGGAAQAALTASGVGRSGHRRGSSPHAAETDRRDFPPVNTRCPSPKLRPTRLATSFALAIGQRAKKLPGVRFAAGVGILEPSSPPRKLF